MTSALWRDGLGGTPGWIDVWQHAHFLQPDFWSGVISPLPVVRSVSVAGAPSTLRLAVGYPTRNLPLPIRNSVRGLRFFV